jgi:hypothetical protein
VRPTKLLRNCSLDHPAGREVDQPESEIRRAEPEAADDTGAVLRVVGSGARVDVHKVVFERAIDQDRELAGADSLAPPCRERTVR